MTGPAEQQTPASVVEQLRNEARKLRSQKERGPAFHAPWGQDIIDANNAKADLFTEAADLIEALSTRTPPAMSADHIDDATNMVAPAEAVAWRFRTADRTFGQPGPWAYGGGPIRLLPGCYEIQPLYTHPPQPDTVPSDMRERVARIIDPAAFLFSPAELGAKDYHHPSRLALERADAILALIQTKRAG